MVSVCLPSVALSQHLPSYLGFSYLGRGVSLHGCSSKAQPMLLTLDEGYLLTAALPGLQRGIAAHVHYHVSNRQPMGIQTRLLNNLEGKEVGGSFTREGIYVCLWLIHAVVLY